MNKKKILIVDDHWPIIRELEILLREKGFETRSETTFTDAVECIKKWNPDYCVLDVSVRVGRFISELRPHEKRIKGENIRIKDREGQVLGSYLEEKNIPFCYFTNFPGSIEPSIHHKKYKEIEKANPEGVLKEIQK